MSTLTQPDKPIVREPPDTEQVYYKVGSIDLSGNESEHSQLAPDDITNGPGIDRRYDNVLFQNVPNPFGGST